MEKEHEKVEHNFQYLIIKLNKLKDKIKSQNNQGKFHFLALDILTEKIRFLPREISAKFL
ncbi:hypothetical protein [Dolichospermum compactum]|nr:hypothetical protein [Dolichospermum compactum]